MGRHVPDAMNVAVFPCGGLFNAMRAISCGYNIAKISGRQLVVNSVQRVDFPFELMDVVQMPFEQTRLPYGTERPNSYIPYLSVGVVETERSEHKYAMDEMLLVEHQDWFIVSGGNFKPFNQISAEVNRNKAEFYNMIQFRPDLVARAKSIEVDSYVGIHLRYTDRVHLMSSDAYVDSIIRKNGTVFLCSDDADKLSYFASRHSNVFVQDGDLGDRNSLRGLENGIVDWLVLANSKKIYASVGSSFSIEARYPNKLPLEQINERNIEDLDWLGDTF